MDSIHPKFGSSVREYAGVVVLGTSVTGPPSPFVFVRRRFVDG
jgi:hypothetical protein